MIAMWTPSWMFLALACCGALVAIKLLRAVVAGHGRRLLIVVAVLCLPAMTAGFLWQGRSDRALVIRTPWSHGSESGVRAAKARRPAKHLKRDHRVAAARAAEHYEEAVQAARGATADALVVMLDEPSAPSPADPPQAPVLVGARRALDAHLVRLGHRESHLPRGLLWSLIFAAAIGAFLYIGYLFLDAGTRGQFTWSLRLLSLVAFSVLWAAMTMLRHTL